MCVLPRMGRPPAWSPGPDEQRLPRVGGFRIWLLPSPFSWFQGQGPGLCAAESRRAWTPGCHRGDGTAPGPAWVGSKREGTALPPSEFPVNTGGLMGRQPPAARRQVPRSSGDAGQVQRAQPAHGGIRTETPSLTAWRPTRAVVAPRELAWACRGQPTSPVEALGDPGPCALAPQRRRRLAGPEGGARGPVSGCEPQPPWGTCLAWGQAAAS